MAVDKDACICGAVLGEEHRCREQSNRLRELENEIARLNARSMLTPAEALNVLQLLASKRTTFTGDEVQTIAALQRALDRIAKERGA